MNINLCALVFANLLSLTTGLRCWTCDNAISEEKCIENGRIERCGKHQKMSCQTEVRFHEGWGGSAMIKTGCKEYHACQDNQRQNPRGGTNPIQCNPKRSNSVCRCCCQGFNCNRRNLLCNQKNVRHSFNIVSSTNRRADIETGTRGRYISEPETTTTVATPTHIKVFIRRPPAIQHVRKKRGPLVCGNLGELKHGKILCNQKKKNVGTTCEFRCLDPEYQLHPNVVLKCVKINGRASWSNKIPQCTRRTSFMLDDEKTLDCPKGATKDVVMILDASQSINMIEWKFVKNLVTNVIREFEVSRDNMRFAVFRFNRVVDIRTQILLGEHANNGEMLYSAINQLPKRGFGTRLGKALKHAKDRVLAHGNRREANDTFLVISGGKTKDMPFLRKISKELRQGGVKIVAVGILDPKEKGLQRQLLAMTGDKNNVVIVKEAAVSFPSKTLVERISRLLC